MSTSQPDPAFQAAETPALADPRLSTVPHRVHRTRPAQSAEESAELQGIDIGALLRTIVVRRGADDYLFVLVPGGRRFDWPKLRTQLGVRRLSLPDADEARAVTGYERGAITPFGASRPWPVVVDAAALAHGNRRDRRRDARREPPPRPRRSRRRHRRRRGGRQRGRLTGSISSRPGALAGLR